MFNQKNLSGSILFHSSAASTAVVGGSFTASKNTLSSPAFAKAVLRQFGGTDTARLTTMTDHSLI